MQVLLQPSIAVNDKALSQIYRERFGSCHRAYQLVTPFTELFFTLAEKAERSSTAMGGYIGAIVSNAFMKAEFGKKLIQEYMPLWDLTHVIDTSGASIPGHNTPTVILFGRNRSPVAPTVRTVSGIRSEGGTPADPAKGNVWHAILQQVDRPGTQSEWVSVTDMPREKFSSHPWSIGGGGVAELKDLLDTRAEKTLGRIVDEIGRSTHTGEDDAFLTDSATSARLGFREHTVGFVEGLFLRDYRLWQHSQCIFPYDNATGQRLASLTPGLQAQLWPLRTLLRNRKDFGQFIEERGLAWWEHSMFFPRRFIRRIAIAFAFLATHNHFVLDRGGKVFNRTAPIITLPAGANEEDHLGLLGILNSSCALFWARQVLFPRGGFAAGKWEERFNWNSTPLEDLPVPPDRPVAVARQLDLLASGLDQAIPVGVLASPPLGLAAALASARERYHQSLQLMIALQEELDWECYEIYGLLAQAHHVRVDEVPPIKLGERAFEILMARKMVRGELETAWFGRHGSTPITELPVHWPVEYRQLVERRIAIIESDRNIALIEQPEYKRRWNTEPWEEQQERALRDWLLGRLEEPRYWLAPELTSCAHLTDKVRRDAEFMEVATLYRGRPDFDLTEMVVELVESESVPFLPVLRYKESGLRKRAIWEQVWDLQRREDDIDARTQLAKEDPNYLPPDAARTLKQQKVGEIPVPPKYDTKDLVSITCWRLRGKLDVPKERFITYPHCNRDADRTPVIGWAGWDHLQQAQAVAGYYERMRTNEGWSDDRLLPLLAGVLELLPWLLQWHNALDPQYGMGLGDFFRSFAEEEARRMGKTLDEVRAWQPPAKAGRKKKGSQRFTRLTTSYTHAIFISLCQQHLRRRAAS